MNFIQAKHPFVFGQNCLDNNLLLPETIKDISDSEFLIDNISFYNSKNSKDENISVIEDSYISNNLLENESSISLNNSIKENNLSKINLLYNSENININCSVPYYNDLKKENYLKIQPEYQRFEIFKNVSQIYKSNSKNYLSESNTFIKSKINFEIKHR
jgi:hypothetical protein